MSSAIYRLLLRLHPAEFRRRWEDEMVYTFELQLADGWFDAWTCALAEIVPVSRAVFAIPLISLVSTGAIFFGLMWALENGNQIRSVFLHFAVKLGG